MTGRGKHTLLNIILLARRLLSSKLLLKVLSRARRRNLRALERLLAHYLLVHWAGSVTTLATFGLRGTGTALFLVVAGVVVVFAAAGLCIAAGDGLVLFALANFRRVAGDG